LSGIDVCGARHGGPGRVGIGGGSYGSYSAWAATAWSERFAAAVVFAGSPMAFDAGRFDIPLRMPWCIEPAVLRPRRSVLGTVAARTRAKCRTPVLIAHGDSDRRVPVGQGVELYTALRLLGREATLVRYPRAGHGLEEAAHQHDYVTRVLDWYERYLKGPAAAASR
jgi:dipeptidyl aminopeptidase/acylaminoacyl peptidase